MVKTVWMLIELLSLSGRTLHLKDFRLVTQALGRLAVLIDSCDIRIRRHCIQITDRTTTTNLVKQKSKITKTPLIWKKRQKLSILTLWILRRPTSRGLEEKKENLCQKKTSKSLDLQSQSNRQARTMQRSQIGITVKTIFSTKNDLNTHTTRFLSLVALLIRRITQINRVKS